MAIVTETGFTTLESGDAGGGSPAVMGIDNSESSAVDRHRLARLGNTRLVLFKAPRLFAFLAPTSGRLPKDSL